ncbi:MAG: DUF4388 domain-containing protein [Anaerolineales bacterium]|nr:DUF4388 domain-containing protein [Anaerolineales bacterium]
MALKGNLRDFTITQLLNLIHLARKTGTLIIEGPSDKAFVSFREGKLAFSQLGKMDNGLASILFRAKKISRSQLKVIRARAPRMSDKELGLLLINANYLSQEDILTSLQNEFIHNLHRLFTWVEGLFRFETGVLPPEDKIILRINLENIIIEGSRQLRELEQLQDELPSLDIALKFTDRPGANLKNVNLNVEEWRVVSYINPKNTLRQIANTAKLSDLEIRRIVYSLLQAGLIELVRAESPKPILRPQTTLPIPDKEEQKSLINRLIQRIRSL